MFFLLAIPIQWGIQWYPSIEKQIQIEFDRTPAPEVIEPQPEIIEEVVEPPVEEVIPPPLQEAEVEAQPQPTPAVEAEQITPQPAAQPQQQIQQPTPEVSTEQPVEPPPESVNQDTAEPNINSGIIFNSIQNMDKDMSISEDFMAAPEQTQDFKPRQWEATDLQNTVDYVNTETDKPRVEMNFYSPGFEGSVERFFDKVTIKKEFTTKYGTKIQCGMVLFIMACSWK